MSYSYHLLLMGSGRNLKEKKARKNLIHVQVQKVHGQYQDHLQVGISQPEYRNITTYDPVALRKIKHVTKTDNKYKQLPFGTIRNIHELRLNRRKRGSRGGQRKSNVMITLDKSIRVVLKNLQPLPYSSHKVTKHTGKLWLLLTNTQSLRNKEDILSDYMRREAIDVVIATETWFTNNDRDSAWLESNGFVRGGYLTSMSNRVGRKGGGIVMIFRSNITATEITQKKLKIL